MLIKILQNKNIIICTTLITLVISCAGDSKKKSPSDSLDNSAVESTEKEDLGEDKVNLSAAKKQFTYSQSNNKMTSHSVSTSKARDYAEQLTSKKINSLIGKIAALRLAKASFSSIQAVAKKISLSLMKKNRSSTIPAALKLELALAAINSKKYSFAHFYINEIIKKKKVSPVVKASAYNALGYLALKDNRVPEAAANFKLAIKAKGNFEAARLNLAFLSLIGGDYKVAGRMLAGMPIDWFTKSGLISISRLKGENSRVFSLCKDVLKTKPKHKATLYNCALHNYQMSKDIKSASENIRKMLATSGGDSSWDKKGSELLKKIKEIERTNKKAKEAKKNAKIAKEALKKVEKMESKSSENKAVDKKENK